ncbi:MAG: hypothetical protein QMD36_02460 [Candidatus Aenigmarchaeota archaeon]|nr:hypothetical protein [Candidatus Aenigmarchaeota archaeon]
MKKIVFTFLFLILFLSSVCAQDIEIIAPDKPVTVYTAKVNELEILVKNNRNVKDIIYFSAWPTQWISLKKYWSVFGAGEIVSLPLDIYPPFDAEEGTSLFTITAKSIDYNVSSSKEIYLLVKRSSPIYLSEVKINKQSFKPYETLVIQPVLTNIDKKERIGVFVTTKILKDNLLIQKFDDSISIDPAKTETLSYNFDIKLTHEPGDYKIVVSVKDNLNKLLDEKSTNFKIEATRRMIEEKETKRSLLDNVVTIKLTNNGNLPESNFNFSIFLPLISRSFFYPEVEPTFQEEKDNRMIYKWLIRELNPGETVTIKYELRFTNVVIISCILTVVIIWIVWLFFQPKLMKKYMGILAKDKDVTISLHVKNKSRKILDNVIVKDFVPAIATVIKEFDTIIPTIKRRAVGTELTWQVKDIRPKEERVLTYKIKPMIEILGDLKLPKAHLVYETKKGKKRRVLSKTITIMRKVK